MFVFLLQVVIFLKVVGFVLEPQLQNGAMRLVC